MRKTWAISGVDLYLDVPASRVRTGIERTLRDAVQAGRLRPGTRLPSSRSLAQDLEIARNTVADAYGQLVAEGWLVARQGSGTTVADRADVADAAAPAREPARPWRYDLRSGRPDLAAFPRTAWLAAMRRAVLDAAPHDFDYPDARGLPVLRTALAEYLGRVRGVVADPEHIVVCAGFGQGIGLLASVLSARGARSVAVESHGLDVHRAALRAHGLRTRPLPVVERGAVVNALGSADSVLLTPAHQFPLGAVLAPERRAAVVDWARARNAFVIEDDYDGEFRYDRHPVGAMQALAPDRVGYAGTASKALVPGLRLGWLVLPAESVDAVAAANADAGTSTLDQLALARFLTDTGYDRQVRRARLAYRRRRDRLVEALRRKVPAARVTGIAAGLHAIVVLPDGQAEVDVVARAARNGLALQGLAEFAIGSPDHPPALVVGYATPPEHAFTGALARLVTVLSAR